MNPGKLFDYLEGKLSEHERQNLEEQLMSEAQLRRELEVARRIHAGMEKTGRERPEILAEQNEATAAKGRKLGRQVLAAAAFLIALNVAFGLYLIARHESSNPNRALLKKQSEDQLRQALAKAATGALTPPPIGVLELELAAERGQAENVAEEIVQMAQRLGGTATRGMVDGGRVEVLAEVEQTAEFHAELTKIKGVRSVTGKNPVPDNEKISLVIQVTEAR